MKVVKYNFLPYQKLKLARKNFHFLKLLFLVKHSSYLSGSFSLCSGLGVSHSQTTLGFATAVLVTLEVLGICECGTMCGPLLV